MKTLLFAASNALSLVSTTNLFFQLRPKNRLAIWRFLVYDWSFWKSGCTIVTTMIDKEVFKQKRAASIEARIKTWAEMGGDHFTAYPLLDRIALAMRIDNTSGERDDFYHDVNTRTVAALAKDGIMAEVYALRGDLGNGDEDTRDYVRVYERRGRPTEIDRLRLGDHQKYVVRASAADLKTESDVE